MSSDGSGTTRMHDTSRKGGGSDGIFIVRYIQPMGEVEKGKSGDSSLPLN